MPKKTRISDEQETPKFGIHYPAQESEVDIAGDFKQLALSVEDALDNLEVDGTPGEKGDDGASAYEIALEKDPSIGTEEEWLESLKGDKGEDGKAATVDVDAIAVTGDPKSNVKVENTGNTTHAVFKFTIPQGEQGKDGKDGSGVSIKGTKTWPEIKKIGDDGDAVDGDMYILKENSADAPAPTATAVAGDGLVWLDNDWSNVGPIQGPQGEPGISPTIQVVGTESVAWDDDAEVVQGGSDTEVELSFKIPEGKPGADGADAQFPADGNKNEVLVKGDGDTHSWKPLVTYEDLSAIGDDA